MPRPSLSAHRALLVALALPAPLVMASACQVVSGLSGYQIGNGGSSTSSIATGGMETGGGTTTASASSSSSGVSSSGASSSGASSSGASSSGASSSGASSSGASSSGASSSGASSSGTTSSGSASSSSGIVGWCGTATCAVGSDYDSVSALAADDAGVYWTALPNTGSPEQIYWAKTGSSNVSSAPLPSGDSFHGLATDDHGKLYYTAGGTDPSHLYALNVADGGATQISATATAAGNAGAVAVVTPSGPDVAWVTQSGSLGLEVTSAIGTDNPVTIPSPPAKLLLSGSPSRHVFFAADANLYFLGPGTATTFLGSAGVVPTLLAPDTNIASGYLYFATTEIRRIAKNAVDGGVDSWLASVNTNVTVTGLVAVGAPFWLEVDNATHVGQILTSQTVNTGTRVLVGGPISAYPRLLAAGGGYLYYTFQDTSASRWHVSAVPMPGP